MLLGEIKQSITDIRELITTSNVRHDALEKRVSSLERTRLWAKAWSAGAAAAVASFVWFAYHVYDIVKEVGRK